MLRVGRVLSPLFVLTLTGICQKDANDFEQHWSCLRGTTWVLPSPSRWHGRQTERSLDQPKDSLERECRKRAVEDRTSSAADAAAAAAATTAAAGIACTAHWQTSAKALTLVTKKKHNINTSRLCFIWRWLYFHAESRATRGGMFWISVLAEKYRIHPTVSPFVF